MAFTAMPEYRNRLPAENVILIQRVGVKLKLIFITSPGFA